MLFYIRFPSLVRLPHNHTGHINRLGRKCRQQMHCERTGRCSESKACTKGFAQPHSVRHADMMKRELRSALLQAPAMLAWQAPGPQKRPAQHRPHPTAIGLAACQVSGLKVFLLCRAAGASHASLAGAQAPNTSSSAADATWRGQVDVHAAQRVARSAFVERLEQEPDQDDASAAESQAAADALAEAARHG